MLMVAVLKMSCQITPLSTLSQLQGICLNCFFDMICSFFYSTQSETQLERVLREIAATIDLPLVFKLSDNLKVAHSTRRAEVLPLKSGKPKKRSLSAGAPIRDTQQQQFSFRRCQSVLPSGILSIREHVAVHVHVYV